MLGLTGKYRLDRRLGGGGMAEVFIGSTVGAEGFSRKVAIKRVLPGFSENPQFAQMFVGEAQMSSRLQHPNIVSVLDFDRDAEGRLFLVMELIEGRDLDALIRTGLLPLPVVIYVVAEVLRGLGYAHHPGGEGAPGLIHRDVSPHNVLLSWDGSVKVSDFGIAKARTASNATASVFIKGKPAYMSPEQANGSPLDGRSDLFAVGIMLWELIVGTRLFVAEDTRGTLAKVLFAQIPTPAEHRADVPPDLNAITMKLLDRDLDARYPTCEDALDDLMACHDAPRAGRDELAILMASRFPSEAPARPRRQSLPGGGVRAPLVGPGSESHRHSPALGVPAFIATAPLTPGPAIAHAPTGAAAAPPISVVPVAAPGAPTMRPGHPAVPAVTFAGVPAAADVTPPLPDTAAADAAQGGPVAEGTPAVVAALRGAPTRTMAAGAQPPAAAPARPGLAPTTTAPTAARRSAGRMVVLGLLVAATVGVSLAVVLRQADTTAAPAVPAMVATGGLAAATAAGPTTVPADARPMIDAAAVDAAPRGQVVASPPPDATPSTTGSASSAGSAAPPSTIRRGELKVSVDPWAYVSIGGGPPALTPFASKVAPGKHSVRIWNEDLGKSVTKTVTIAPGKSERIYLNWQ